MRNPIRFFFGAIPFLMGLLLGLGTGLLLAPRSGRETRRRLGGVVDEAGEHLEDIAHQAKQRVSRIVKHGKKWVKGKVMETQKA